MQNAIRMFLLATVLSGCAQAPPPQADKQPAPTPQANAQKLSPEQEQFKQAFSKMIKDGHVNNACQDLKGMWEVVARAEKWSVCRPETGFHDAGPGYVQLLQTLKDGEGGGFLMPAVFDCVGRRWFHDQTVSYDSIGKIKAHGPVALGGQWESIKPGSQADMVRETVCKGEIK